MKTEPRALPRRQAGERDLFGTYVIGHSVPGTGFAETAAPGPGCVLSGSARSQREH
jgi:hypothetical protein